MTNVDWTLFGARLLGWYRPDRRPMPWKEESDPYRIWLSEVILQQTRVEQGLPYFQRFVAAYPTVHDLAAAPDEAVMKRWEGLGYYSRARNLLAAARQVVSDYGGAFPDTYLGLKALPGVGPYTAAAIASFAFGRPVAVLDGNVYRVLARYGADATPVNTGKGRVHFQALVDEALGEHPAARFNQAIMDFGALVCTPKRADCGRCPLAETCRARQSNTVYDFPRKGKKGARRDRYFHYLVIVDGSGRYLLEQRGAGDIWESLFQFPLVETTTLELTVAELAAHPDWPVSIPAGNLRTVRRSKVYTQQLSHQRIGVVFHVFDWPLMSLPADAPLWKVARADFVEHALPRVITRFLADATLTLGF